MAANRTSTKGAIHKAVTQSSDNPSTDTNTTNLYQNSPTDRNTIGRRFFQHAQETKKVRYGNNPRHKGEASESSVNSIVDEVIPI